MKNAAVFSRGIIKRTPQLPAFIDARPVFRPSDAVAATIDFVVGWGRKDNTRDAMAYAERHGLPYITLEDGFLRSVGLGVSGEPPLSVVLDGRGIYYDATRPSRLEAIILSGLDEGAPSPRVTVADSVGRARECINRIVGARLSKYNAAPEVVLPSTDRPRVLVVDQTAGDLSIRYGLADAGTFDRMLQAAIDENPSAEVIVKTHPDVVAGKKRGHLADTALQRGLTLLAEDVNPIGLLEKMDRVYVVTSQLGFEALMTGKPVTCFGAPFYAGWGLTDDRLEIPRRSIKRTLEEVFAAAYILYPRYVDPDSGERCEIERVIEHLALQRHYFAENAGYFQCLGFTLWKRNYVRRYLRGPGNRIDFVRRISRRSAFRLKPSVPDAHDVEAPPGHVASSPSGSGSVGLKPDLQHSLNAGGLRGSFGSLGSDSKHSRRSLGSDSNYKSLESDPKLTMSCKSALRPTLSSPDAHGIEGPRERFASSPVRSDLVGLKPDLQDHEPGRETADRLVVWGSKETAAVRDAAGRAGVDLWRMEDGFIRSPGLGSDLTPPASLVLDRSGIYYDPNRPSDLETLLRTEVFTPELVERARKLRERILAGRLSKYNVGEQSALETGARPGQRRILVPGQVEDDASIQLGCRDVRTNAALIRAVREAAPDAWLIYKPHPDVVSGNRRGRVDAGALALCDQVIVDVGLVSCLDAVDEVHTLTSLVGFEALMRGLTVATYGLPFYAGWGLTTDRHAIERRGRELQIDELVAGTLVLYPRYVNPDTGQFTTVEYIVDWLERRVAEARGTTLRMPWIVRQLRKGWHLYKGLRG